MNVRSSKSYREKRRLKSFQPGVLLIFIPVIAAVLAIYYLFGNKLAAELGNRGNQRLTTVGWQQAQATLDAAKPQYGPKFAYFKLLEGQTLAWAAAHFGVSLTELQQMNPGNVVWGTTIIVPPVQTPLTPFPASKSTLSSMAISQANGAYYVTNPFTAPEAYVTIPQLMTFLKADDVIEQLGPKEYMINKPLFVADNIQLDITAQTVSKLLLRSSPNFNITTLTIESSEALLENTSVSTYDPTTGMPASSYNEGRSFLRAYENGRMDIINSNLSYLGMTLDEIKNPSVRIQDPFVAQGGVYGVAWRIGTGTFGSEIATGWVENSTFEHNYIGAFTFGASGMMWLKNLFTDNHVYGLDPHDDSNNATIEYNRFVANGKHGFIMSKRCDYNTIEYNVSIDNAFHGFMLHDNSDYNIIEHNVSIGNYDNFAVYASSYNEITDNNGYNPRGSQVRINEGSLQNYVENNNFYGGHRGVYLYSTANGVDIENNNFYLVGIPLATKGTTRVLYAGNNSNVLDYQIGKGDRVVFGVNYIHQRPYISLAPLQILSTGKLTGQPLTTSAMDILLLDNKNA